MTTVGVKIIKLALVVIGESRITRLRAQEREHVLFVMSRVPCAIPAENNWDLRLQANPAAPIFWIGSGD